MLGALVPCGGGDTIPLIRDRLLVGRRSQCDICIRLKTVSSRQCELELRDGYWHIRDLGSSNGIKVNGLRVETKCLMPGDEVMIAKEAFNIDYELDPNAGPAEDENPFEIPLMQKAGLQANRQSRMPEPAETPERRRKRLGSTRDHFLMEWLPED